MAKQWYKLGTGEIFTNPLSLNGKIIINPTSKQLMEAGYRYYQKPIRKKITVKTYENAIQRKLDKTAKDKGYDDCYTLLSYIQSTNEVYNREANAYNTWRDRVWETANEMLNDYTLSATSPETSATFKYPKVGEVLSALPQFDWDNLSAYLDK